MCQALCQLRTVKHQVYPVFLALSKEHFCSRTTHQTVAAEV